MAADTAALCARFDAIVTDAGDDSAVIADGNECYIVEWTVDDKGRGFLRKRRRRSCDTLRRTEYYYH